MAGACVLATALTTHAARNAILLVGNVDVIDDPTSSNRYGVPYDSISVTEQGPNGVSSMTFAIDDPFLLISVDVGMEVRFSRFPASDGWTPEFLGYVQSFGISPSFGMQGRSIAVEAIGVEAVLDWAVITTDTVIPAGLEYYAAVQKVVAASAGTGELRALVSGSAPSAASDAFPMAMPPATFYTTLGLTVTAGTSLREAIRQVIANLTKIGMGSPGTVDVFDGWATVDFFRGLRMWGSSVGSGYASMVINDTTGVDAYAEGLDYAVDASGVTRGVYLQGTGFAQLLMDGSGLPGPISYLTDDKADTAAKVTASAQTYLDDFATGVRGSFRLEDRDPEATPMSLAHPGSTLNLVDTRIPVNTALLIIGTIEKSYHGIDSSTRSQTWTVSFGGMPPSIANAMRRLTRTLRN